MNSGPEISIIIPTLNEEVGIGSLLNWLTTNASPLITTEIILVDGGSTDRTIPIAKNYTANIVHSDKGRAKQMNAGAAHAKGNILYFLHADTFPEKDYDSIISNAITKDCKAGCFRMRFDTTNPILQFFAWLTRFNLLICRGGDQSLFITKTLFNQLNGFDERYTIYEDSEFIKRIYQQARFKVLPNYVTTSSRRYKETGWLQTQYYFGIIHLKNRLGAPPQELYGYYQRKFGA
ncbi:TIGR04283 family arsenosugar biosynthesis glycosyltransferase [Flavobacterium sp. ASW18X]|uniref:TIGR04283 family arsenosugar biosynthesis glycosyltransferase n=1 Tax=Flavobacterium sp. ASW18X TaxID=2572595 RepID=UPI0010AE3618|nr:TIGR04283 family arsenosugar biosynthesis glycosyltransferase [Flavobacterium sp. ASW18X]TKD60985.1 glycosyltransferase [Flavobacterium sp. ASW18X]